MTQTGEDSETLSGSATGSGTPARRCRARRSRRRGDGQPLLEATLGGPGDLLLGDDRRTLHGVSPIRTLDGHQPARRGRPGDVLVTTLVPAEN
ncbi:2OG-Fe dioxygenase family protein [Streptomyces violens]|uniref:2OG-Fe dioxygenase family protein n=1 Tax=Streptomyces violens TaxID=66377 RepID=UPI0012FF0D01|nr:2OG-Fe dioxygenase family protein [Streptomyces violens]